MLGEKILVLRTQKNMSQGDLADALDVSRQSVSKWENNVSVPELDKLIAMSDLFGVTLDSLVKGQEEEVMPQKELVQESKTVDDVPRARIIVGAILLSVGLIGCLLSLGLGLLGLCWFTGYLLIVGGLCVKVKRNFGLIVNWFTFIIAQMFFNLYTSAGMKVVFNPGYYAGVSLKPLLLAYVWWIWFVVLIGITCWQLKKKGRSAQ